MVAGGSRVLRRCCGFVAGVLRHRRNLAVLRGRHLTVIRCGCSRLAIVGGWHGRLAVSRGRLVEAGCGRVRSGEIRGYRRAVWCAVSTLRHGGCRRAIVKTCALRLAGKSHEHDIDNAAGQRNQRTNDRRAKTAGGHAAITIVITAKAPEPAVQCRTTADNHDDKADNHRDIENGNPPARLVRVMQTADGKCQGGD